MRNQKGFIQIPLLIGIIVAVVITSAIGAGVVLHKQGSLDSFLANISQTTTETEESIIVSVEERGQEELSEQLLIDEETTKSQLEQEPEQAEPETPMVEITEAEKPELKPIDGNWSEWSNWSECQIDPSKLECGEAIVYGERTRTRFCNNPEPAYGGKDCVGLGTEAKSCETVHDYGNCQSGYNCIDNICIRLTEVGGIISSDTTWKLENSPYVMTDTVQIPSGITLTIEPGVKVIKPTSGDMFLLLGTIKAYGTDESKIIFDGGDNSDFFKVSGYGHAFLDLKHSIIKNGFMFWPGGNRSGYFRLQYSELTNLTKQSTIWFSSGNIDISYNKFINTYGFRIFVDNNINVSIKNNLFYRGRSINDTGYFNYFMMVSSGDSSEITFKYNSFIDMPKIVLRLEENSINTFSASENYWGTQDKNAIESMIYDKNDDVRCIGYIDYQPILNEPHLNTPKP